MTQASKPASTPASAVTGRNGQDQGQNRFFEALLASNPFAINRISDPDQMDFDATQIHAAAYQELLSRSASAFSENRSRAALLLGGAGIGKSHLLARLKKDPDLTKSCYVFLHNIQVQPDQMDRYLVKCCLAELVGDRRAALGTTPLFNILEKAFRSAAKDTGIGQVSRAQIPTVSRKLAQELGSDAEVCETLFKLFFELMSAKQNTPQANKSPTHEEAAALAVRWLQGDLLDAEEAKQLGQKVPHGHETTQLAEDQVPTILPTIARLARRAGYRFILCLDQIDNMKHPQITALARACQTLLDTGAPLFIVVSGVRQDVEQLLQTGVIPEAAADRLEHKQPVLLERIKRTEAAELLRVRLSAFLEDFDALPEQARPFVRDDSLFPLGEAWFQAIEPGAIEMRPRDVLNWASARWRDNQQQIRDSNGNAWLKVWPNFGDGPGNSTDSPSVPREELIDRKVALKVKEAVDARTLQPGTLPADADNLLGLTVSLLEHCLSLRGEYTVTSVAESGPALLTVTEKNGDHMVTNVVLFIATGSKNFATRQLKLLLDAQGATHKILVTDHDRLPLQVGPTGKKRLDELQKLGSRFQRIELKFADYAQLDAMQSVAQTAQTGDLEIEPQPGQPARVTQAEVIGAHHRADRYRKHILVGPLVSEPIGPPPPPHVCPFDRDRFREHVLARLSFMIGAGLRELLQSYHASLKIRDRLAEPWWHCAKDVAMKLHAEQKVGVRPWEDDLYLTRR